jgi:dTDP-4-amino-4,6-dideoxygalactose transaminase
MKHIPFLRPQLVEQTEYGQYIDQIEANRIYTNYGPLNTLFEARLLERYFDGNGGALTVNNATIGLMLAIMDAKRPHGRYALMPSFTFAATPLAAMWCGLTPYFLDVNPDTWCLEPDQVAQAIQKLGDDVAVVVPYATFGVDMNLSWYAQLHRNGLPVVVDAAASFGSRAKVHNFGTDFPGFVVYSFHATKSFAIGEGGMIYSASSDHIQRLRKAANFGFGGERTTTMMGLNAKLPEFTAAIGLATLDRFPEKIAARGAIFKHYLDRFEAHNLFNRGWQPQSHSDDVAHQFFPVLCPLGESNRTFVDRLEMTNIQARTYFSPACHQQPFFASCPSEPLSVTIDLSERILSLPLWEDMQFEDVERVVAGIA